MYNDDATCLDSMYWTILSLSDGGTVLTGQEVTPYSK